MRGDFYKWWTLVPIWVADAGSRCKTSKGNKTLDFTQVMCFLFWEIRFPFVFFCLHDFWVADGGAQAQQNQFVGDHFLPDI